MVRKRSRKYESSDENDSDSDTEFSGANSNKTSSQPAAKRYSLRERRAPPPEFDFFGLADEDDDDDGDDNDDDNDDGVDDSITKLSSDDEDFEVDLKKSKRKQKKGNNTNDDNDGDYNQESDNEVETLPFKNCEATLESSTDNGLIDFEDIIRADIVVRKKIDYDHIIEKSTICLNSDKQAPSSSPKSKNFYNETNDEQLNIFEPHIETHTQMDDDDGNNLLNLENNMPATSLPDFINNEENSNKIQTNGTELQRNLDTVVNDSGGGGGSDNNTINSCNNNNNTNNNNVEDDEDDDVIVLGEVKQDIIVLDD